jgi:hypothetical protein
MMGLEPPIELGLVDYGTLGKADALARVAYPLATLGVEISAGRCHVGSI